MLRMTSLTRISARPLLVLSLLMGLTSAGCPGLVFTLEPKTALSDDEGAAVDEALRQFLAEARVVASWGDLRPGLIALETTSDADAAACPAVGLSPFDDDVTAIVVDYDALACAGGARVGDVSAAGRVTYRVDPRTASGELHFDRVLLDGHAVVGTASLGYALLAADHLELAGAMDLDTSDAGPATGVVNATFTSDGEFTIANGVWRTGALDFDIEIIGPTAPEPVAVTITPTGNPRFIPRTGELAFWLTPLTRIEIKFAPDSPETGEVAVIWNEVETFRRTIPE